MDSIFSPSQRKGTQRLSMTVGGSSSRQSQTSNHNKNNFHLESMSVTQQPGRISGGLANLLISGGNDLFDKAFDESVK